MKRYVLGLDLGSSSLGWSAVAIGENGEPNSILKMGVRVFSPGMNDIDTTKPSTPASVRRVARLTRRQTDRRRRRKLAVFHLLRAVGLVSMDENSAAFTERIDRETAKKYMETQINPGHIFHILPYFLRKRGLDESLSREELGRVFYHLAQRRGFKSNRKELRKQDENGIVYKGITELHKLIEDSRSRTLGEYFTDLKSKNDTHRIRERYTSRDMFEREFEFIYEKQKLYYPSILTPEFKKRMFNALFFQRPLKSAKHLVGYCEYETKSKRCGWYREQAQQFRIIQDINNLKIINPGNEKRALTDSERHIVFEKLNISEKLTFKNIKEILNFQEKEIKISLEAGEREYLNGNKTAIAMQKIFGEDWESYSQQKKEIILNLLNASDSIEALRKIGIEKYGLNEQKADLFAHTTLQDGYCGLSLRAIEKLLPLMMKGLTYPEAVEKVYGAFKQRTDVLCELPMPEKVIKNLTNPLVSRCLTEVRICINALIKEYGKPECIHIELAREIKSTKKGKEEKNKTMRENEIRRIKAKEELIKCNIINPSHSDITKYLLWLECNRQCPYTGNEIGFADLFTQYEIEHIIPFSISLDDSFSNKTLCFNEENRKKGNRTPYQAYASDEEKYTKILSRVMKFSGKYRDVKYERFILQDISEYNDLPTRLMNDTRYASKLAMEYLTNLYGGLWDENGKKKIYCNSGSITAYMRRFYGLNPLLGGETKNRGDHRHHSIDALAIALTSDATIKAISDYAKKYWINGRASVKEPMPLWQGFWEETHRAVESINPVHHFSRKVRGKLHEETFYGSVKKEKHLNELTESEVETIEDLYIREQIQRIIKTSGDRKIAEIFKNPEKYRKVTDLNGRNIEKVEVISEGDATIRKRLEKITIKEIDCIKDEYIRMEVKRIMMESGKKEPSDVFTNSMNLPVIIGKNNITIPIKSVILKKKLSTFSIGTDKRRRNVTSEFNHHLEIVAVLDESENEIKWEGYCVSMFEAYRRKKNREPIIRREFGAGRRFKFSLCEKSIIELEENGQKNIYIVRSIPQSLQVSLVKLTDARKVSDIKASKDWYSPRLNTLKKARCKKLIQTPFGELRNAND